VLDVVSDGLGIPQLLTISCVVEFSCWKDCFQGGARKSIVDGLMAVVERPVATVVQRAL